MSNSAFPEILITGAGGYIGSALRSHLSLAGTPYYSVDADSDECLYPGEVKLLGGILHFNFPGNSVKVIVHLSGLSGELRTQNNPEEARTSNIEGTKKVLALAHLHKGCHFIFVSTASIYDDGNAHHKMQNEDSKTNPFTLYNRLKLEAEEYAHSASESIKVTILRMAVVYGSSPHMRLDTLIHSYIYSSIHSQTINVFGSGESVRPTLAMTHAIKAIRHVIEQPPIRFALYNVVSENLRLIDYANRIVKIASNNGSRTRIVLQKDKKVSSYAISSRLPISFIEDADSMLSNTKEAWDVIKAIKT